MFHLSAIFASVDAAALARRNLVDAGVTADRVVLSRGLTEDAIAAEYPGQSYENQNDRSSDQIEVAPGVSDTDRARYNQELRTAACVLTVQVAPGKDEAGIARLLREHGAKSVVPVAI